MADRRRWTLKQKKEHVAAFRASGMSVRDYCAQENAPGTSCLVRWCRRITESGRTRPKRRRASAPQALIDSAYDQVMVTPGPSKDRPAGGAEGDEVHQLRCENLALRRMLMQAWAGRPPV